MSRAELLQEVNARVNAYPYSYDVMYYGMPDFWERVSIAKTGDCEDFALEKRAQLLQAGVPLEDIRLAICKVETGEPHAVLVVRDGEGDWVLDNRQPGIFNLDTFNGLGYRGVSLQVPGQFMWEQWA